MVTHTQALTLLSLSNLYCTTDKTVKYRSNYIMLPLKTQSTEYNQTLKSYTNTSSLVFRFLFLSSAYDLHSDEHY